MSQSGPLVSRKDQVSVARLQRRLLHTLAQLAEQHLGEKLTEEELPPPNVSDAFHPAKKWPRCNNLTERKFATCLVSHASFDRDGRRLRKERKPRNYMAIDRFLAKTSGLFGKTDDRSLRQLGLAELCPSHPHRLLTAILGTIVRWLEFRF